MLMTNMLYWACLNDLNIDDLVNKAYPEGPVWFDLNRSPLHACAFAGKLNHFMDIYNKELIPNLKDRDDYLLNIRLGHRI